MLKYHNISSDQIIVNARANSTWKERRVIWKWVYDCPLNVCFGARVNDVSDYQGGVRLSTEKKNCVAADQASQATHKF